jgi:copper chaperone CopZ
MEGVHEAEVHFNTGRIEVEHDNEAVSEQNLIDAIQDTGYQAKVSNF